MRTPRELGLILRGRHRDLGLGQEALAQRAGVSRQWVVEVEQGKPRAELGLVLRLIRVMGLWIEVHATPSDSELADLTRSPRAEGPDT